LSNYSDRGIERIESVYRDYVNFTEKILPQARITGTYAPYFGDLCKKLEGKIQSSILILKNQSKEIKEVDSLVRILEIAKVELAEYYHIMLDVARGTSRIPKNLHFFADEMFVTMTFDKNIPYLIKSELSADTPSSYELFKDTARQHLITFSDAREYLNDMRLHLICLNPSMIDNPLDWVLIGHEVAHILEKESLRIVESKYPQIRPLNYSTPYEHPISTTPVLDKKEPKWCLEGACDIIASIGFGPIYGLRLIENFLVPSEQIFDSHPPWKYRLNIIASELERLDWTDDSIRIRDYIKDIKLPSSFDERFEPHAWEDVRKEIRSVMQQRQMEYVCTPARKETIRILTKRLNENKPCVTIKGKPVDPRDILNAACYVEENLSKGFEFREFLIDMIRLSQTDKIYKKIKLQISSSGGHPINLRPFLESNR